MKQHGLRCGVLCLLVLPLLACDSPDLSPSPRPSSASFTAPPAPSVSIEEGKGYLEKGLEAVQQGDWTLAGGYFAKAREADPWSPTPLFNLGLVNAKAGRELLAMAWLRAYLASATDAPNSAAVVQEIERLKGQLRSKVKKLLATATDSFSRLENPSQKIDAARWLAWNHAGTGDFTSAVSILRVDTLYKDKSEENLLSQAWESYATELAKGGDESGALEALQHTSNPSTKDTVWSELSTSFREDGDLASARRAALHIEDRGKKSGALAEIDELLIWDGDFVPAESDLPGLDPERHAKIFWALSLQLAEEGNLAAASNDVHRIPASAGEYDLKLKADGLAALALAQLRQGDAQSAKASAREILSLGGTINSKYDCKPSVVAAAILGNYPGASSMIGQLDCSSFLYFIRDDHFARLAFVQAMNGDLRSAEETAQRARHPVGTQKSIGTPDWWIADALIARGDLERAFGYVPRTRLNLPASLLARIARAYMKSGRLDKAEDALQQIPLSSKDPEWGPPPKVWLLQWKLAALIDLAEAYRRNGSSSDATRVLGGMIQLCRDRSLLSDRTIAERYEKVAKLQRDLGDPAGAAATVEILPPRSLRKWVSLAEDLGRFPRNTNLEESLRSESKDKSAKDLVDVLGSHAQWLCRDLYRIEAVEKRFPRTEGHPLQK